MEIIDKSFEEITLDEKLNNSFKSVRHNNLDISCNFLEGSFFADSHNYFPLTKEFFSFKNFFSWGDDYKYENFYLDEFLLNFEKNKKSFKELSEVVVLGSSSADNYYRNMITFLPRIFFLRGKQIKLAIHRNSSNKFRDFISKICIELDIENQFVFLDDGFYDFTNSKIPQFLDNHDSIKILNKLVNFENKKQDKIYLSRQYSKCRNLINEGDITLKLKKEGFRVVDLNNMSIFEQIEIFSNASVVVSPTSSSLTNIVFCAPGTKVIEIIPKYQFEYEDIFKQRYSEISHSLNLDYLSLEADSVKLDKIDQSSAKFISSKVLNESNYYKNLLLKLEKVKEILSF